MKFQRTVTCRSADRSAGFPACGFSGLSSPEIRRAFRVTRHYAVRQSVIGNRQSAIENAFSMVELLVAMTLLSLIVFALMAVFNSTQRAFRASVTQTGILEGGRAAVETITTDLRNMVPSYGQSNLFNGQINFFAATNDFQRFQYYQYTIPLQYQPLAQTLPGSGVQRLNQLEYFYVLSRNNLKWTGVGYVVNTASSSPLYPLYRFYCETNVSLNPNLIYSNFLTTLSYDCNFLPNAEWTNMSHMVDGVVHLTVDAFDANGYRMTNTVQYHGNLALTNRNIWFYFPPLTRASEVGFAFYTNAVPAAVELQFGLLEDRTLQRAESLGVSGSPPPTVPAQWNYLQQQAGHMELFRQRVTIANVDYSAYQ